MSATRITLSLISHTNVGKTTLARTLLRREVGEVFDAPHVTDVSTEFTLLETPDGSSLRLWDTPGFGDSVRLWQRLKLSHTAFLGFLTTLWDRFTDRPLWCSQQAMINVRDHADVVLYLANAAENPAAAAYIRPELNILRWLGKPLLVLLNQTGPPRDVEIEAAEVARWRDHFTAVGHPCRVMVFDAFARCWVQEEVLWRAVRELLPDSAHAAMDACVNHWREQNAGVFRAAMRRLGGVLAKVAADREALPAQSFAEKVLAPVAESFRGPQRAAMARLGERLVTDVSAALDDLIRLHGLSGEAARIIEARFEDNFAVSRPASKSVAGTIGGFLTGALTGLKADLMAGGLTFFGGAVIGGLLGAAGGVLAAEGYNLVRGDKTAYVTWSPVFLAGILESVLLRYLAVAHFGRGRGQWSEGEHPRRWKEVVTGIIDSRRKEFEAAVEKLRRSQGGPAIVLEEFVAAAASRALRELYPEAVSDDLYRQPDRAHRPAGGLTSPA